MTVRFAHISDTHIGPTEQDYLYGVCTYPRLIRLIDELNRRADEFDFVIHTGDVVRDPDPSSFQLAAQALAKLQAPCFIVNGNHDSAAGLHKYFPLTEVTPLDPSGDKLTYHFQIGPERFVVLDAKGPAEIDPEGQLDERQLDTVSQWLGSTSKQVTVFIHFPAIPLDSAWVDEKMLIRNGDRLHALLSSHAPRIRGVFFGHVHRGVQASADNLLYCSVASTFCQFHTWPNQTSMLPDNPGQIFFNLVSLLPHQIVIKQMWQ